MQLAERIALKPGEVPASVVSPAYLSIEARQLAGLHSMELVASGKDFVMLTGSSNRGLANSVAQLLEKKLYYSIDTYPNGCVNGHIPVSVAGKHTIVLQSTDSSYNGDPNVNMAELENICYTAKTNMGACHLTVVDPAMADMRADRKTASGMGIAAKLHADIMKTVKVDRIMTLDFHAKQEPAYFDFPVDELYGSYVLIPYVMQIIAEEGLKAKMGAIDLGTEARNRAWARRISEDGKSSRQIVQFLKERDVQRGGKPKIIGVEGDIEGFDLILADDVYSSGESVENCARYAKEHGAKSVRGVFTHGEFLGYGGKTGVEILNESALDEVIVTDTIDLPDEIRNHPKVRVVSVAPLLAEAIYRNLMDIPLSDLVD